LCTDSDYYSFIYYYIDDTDYSQYRIRDTVECATSAVLISVGLELEHVCRI